jgi:tetrahydromethanopterin S-methyltransferase subunit B
MPQQINCDMCGAEPAELMQTSLANGDVIAIGHSCQLAFHLTVVESILDAMPADVAKAYGDQVASIIAKLDGHVDDMAIAMQPTERMMDEDPETGDMVEIPVDHE